MGTGGGRRAGRSGAPPGAGAGGAEPRLSHGLTQPHQTAGAGTGAPRLPPFTAPCRDAARRPGLKGTVRRAKSRLSPRAAGGFFSSLQGCRLSPLAPGGAVLPRPLVTIGEGEGLMQIPERCELIPASQRSPGELERPEQGWVETAAPQRCWVPRYPPPGGRRAVPSEDSLGRSEEHAGVSLCRVAAGLLCPQPLGFPRCSSGWREPSRTGFVCRKRGAQFCPDRVQPLPSLNNTRA